MRKLKDKKITIYEKVSGKDSSGFPINGYRPFTNSPQWAYYRQLSEKELYRNSTTNLIEECLFTVNWSEDLAGITYPTDFYLEYNGKWYVITRIDPYEGYKRDLTIYAKFFSDRAPGPIIP